MQCSKSINNSGCKRMTDRVSRLEKIVSQLEINNKLLGGVFIPKDDDTFGSFIPRSNYSKKQDKDCV